MFGFGFSEMLIIFVLGVIVIGPERLPEVFRFLGRQYGKLMRASQDLRRAFMMEAERADAEYRAEQLKIRREEAKQRLAEQLRKAEAGESVPVSSDASPYVPFDIDPENDPHLNSDDPLPLPAEAHPAPLKDVDNREVRQTDQQRPEESTPEPSLDQAVNHPPNEAATSTTESDETSK